jgi:serine/threonine protein kinase
MSAGDLAARNVLVDSRRGCILADFDLARWPGSVEQKCADQVPVRWAAPELFRKKKPTLKSDVWSLGTLKAKPDLAVGLTCVV